MASSSDAASSAITIHLSLTSSPSSPRVSLTLDPHATTASDLRRKASSVTSVPLSSLKLIFRGRMITDKDGGDVAKEFKLEDGCVVHVMGKPANAAAGGAASAASNGSVASSSASGASVSIPSSANTDDAVRGGAAARGIPSPADAAIAKLRSSNDAATCRTALATADKLLGNIVSHPMEEKYRTIKRSNPAFSRRLGAVAGGADLMLAAGFDSDFSDGVEYFVLRPSAEAWPRLTSTKEVIRRTLADFDSARSAPPAAAAAPVASGGMPDLSNLFPGGMPPAGGGAGGMGGMGGMPDAATMQNMLSDPNMLQNVMGMMNNPMIQNMIRSDPRLANNPMLQQSLEALRSNPDMINQFASMMGDPNVRDRVNNMMQGAGGGAAGGGARGAAVGGAGGAAGAADPFGSGPEAMRRQMEQFQRMSQQYGGTGGGFNAGGGGGGSGAGTSAGAANGTGAPSGGNASNDANNAGTSDSDMTEEEMIAEAIARSLRES